MSEVEKRTEELAAYISTRYGTEQLGILRLLTTFSFFRKALKIGDVSRLLGVSMISFEKILRERNDIHYACSKSEFSVVSGNKRGFFPDDPLRSNSRDIVRQIRELFPEYRNFCLSPIIQVGVGANIDDLLTSLDLGISDEYLSKNAEQLKSTHSELSDDIDNYNDATTLVTAFTKYQKIEALSNICAALRARPEQSEPFPFCEKEDLTDILFGIKDDCSVPKRFLKTKKFLECLQEAHPTGVLDADGNFILGGSRGLLELMGFPASIKFDFALLTETVDDKKKTIKTKTQPTDSDGKIPVDRVTVKPELASWDGVDEAYNHVVKYAPLDINSLTKKEQNIALYGTRNGYEAYKKASDTWKKKLCGLLPPGPQAGTIYIVELATFMRKKLRSLTEIEIALLAAGRFVAWKNLFDFGADGVWKKCVLDASSESDWGDDD